MSTPNEKITASENKSNRQPKKNVRMLRKRHDQVENEHHLKMMLGNGHNSAATKEASGSKSRNSTKSSSGLSDVKEVLTSDNENEKTATLSESSESFDSNDEFRVELQLREDPEKDRTSSDGDEEDDDESRRSQSLLRQSSQEKSSDSRRVAVHCKTPVNDPTLPSKYRRFPPRPVANASQHYSATLDRRQRSRSQSNRRERDSKSRSTHSLREKDLNEKNLICDNLSKDHSSSSNHRRISPVTWEFPPPPPFAPWDYNYYQQFMASHDDLRSLDYYRRPYDPYRMGSCQDLHHHPSQLSLSGHNCESNPYLHYQPPLPPPCCGNYYNPNYPQQSPQQRQDNSSERLRKLQSDKDALQLQVQILTEQVNAQSDKLKELEMTINEKNMVIGNSEDLLNREMLSRSSLETQKLELLSAMSELKLQQATLERENFELRSAFLKNSLSNLNHPMLLPRSAAGKLDNKLSGSHGNLSQNLSLVNTTASPEFSRQRNDIHYSSLPRPAALANANLSISSSGGMNGNGHGRDDVRDSPRRNVAFSEKDKIIDDSIHLPQRNYAIMALTSPSMSQKHKGLRGIFGKIKSNGNNTSLVEDSSIENDGQFVRGGTRATWQNGTRTGWSCSPEKLKRPFKEWDIDALSDWFEKLGLDYAVDSARKWLKTGDDLINAAPLDVEKELNLKSHLHRKKILLAMCDEANLEDDILLKKAGQLDTNWVLRWLDDIGLPQHKDEFLGARIDGRVLHRLTVDDLVSMHITSSLHYTSLKRGIQLLREQNFNPDCLVRRLEDPNKDKVLLWTSHCIMEWLRLVDLAEYAPNLRGSGVHGSLMVKEIKFNAELLADLLSIPANKSLLRRHLQTHFTDLLGRDVIQGKREAENTLGFQPLTIAGKIKTPKKSQFSLKRKKSLKNDDAEFTNYVCPLKDFDEIDDNIESIVGNFNKSNSSRSSVKSCFTGAS